MGLFDDIKTESSKLPGVKCGVTRALVELGQDDSKLAADLQRALDDSTIYGTTISDVLRKRGLHVTGYTIQRHRRKICSCDRADGK